jgi:hypothetical protein
MSSINKNPKGGDMKKIRILIAVALVVFFAVPAMAAKAGKNSVKVTGDMAKDGYATVSINWFVDTAKYPGMNREAIRAKVKNEIWQKMDDMILALTKGTNVTTDSHNFSVLREHHDVIETRPNGTKVYALVADVRFNAVPAAQMPAPAAAPAPAAKKESKGFTIQQHWNNEF